MKPTPKERLAHAIAVADGMNMHSGGAQFFADNTGASLTYKNGAYVLQHCGIRVYSPWKSPDMPMRWLEKAQAKFAELYP